MDFIIIILFQSCKLSSQNDKYQLPVQVVDYFIETTHSNSLRAFSVMVFELNTLDLQRPVHSVPITTNVVIELKYRSWRGVLDPTSCDKVWQ